MPPHVDLVIALQEQVGHHLTDAPEYPDEMTGREVEVLCLIAKGKSNQAIAEDLVEQHITNIYAKIGAQSRATTTAYVLSHELLGNR